MAFDLVSERPRGYSIYISTTHEMALDLASERPRVYSILWATLTKWHWILFPEAQGGIQLYKQHHQNGFGSCFRTPKGVFNYTSKTDRMVLDHVSERKEGVFNFINETHNMALDLVSERPGAYPIIQAKPTKLIWILFPDAQGGIQLYKRNPQNGFGLFPNAQWGYSIS